MCAGIAAFELFTRALIGIALDSIQAAGRQVSLPQFRLLLALDGLGKVPTSKLAAQLGLARSTTTRMVDRLQHAGLVQRGTDPHSRCIVTVELTAVRAIREFTSLSGDAIALGKSGPVPL